MNLSSTFSSKRKGICGFLALLLVVGLFGAFAWSAGYNRLLAYGWDNTDLPALVDRVEEIGKSDHRNTVFFLSDSTTVTRMTSGPVGEKLQRLIPRTPVETLWHARLHMPHFYILARQWIKSKPRAIVVTLNLASLSQEWYATDAEQHFAYLAGLIPLSELWRDRDLYCRFFGTRFSSLLACRLAYKTRMLSPYLAWRGLRYHMRTKIKQKLQQWTGHASTSQEIEAPATQRLTLMNIRISPDSWAIRFACKLRDLGQAYGVPVLFYVSPVDHEGLRHHGIDLGPAIKSLNKTMAAEHLEFVNLWQELGHQHFLRINGADPMHYDDAGGLAVAHALYGRWKENL